MEKKNENSDEFEKFAKDVFPNFEEKPFHKAYYRLLQAFAEGKVKRLIITMPPQHGKSHGASVLLPAYILGKDPNRKVAIASYSATLATKFNRRAQRVMEGKVYEGQFPGTKIKKGGAGKKAGTEEGSWVRTADHVEVIGQEGELMSVGREGPLTGNRVDTFIIDDLLKDAMEANSPVVRDNCWEWYTSVVRTREHNGSSEIIVNTRWSEDDLIGRIMEREEVHTLRNWWQVDNGSSGDVWIHLNLEAIKAGEPTEVDPREKGEALWEERHAKKLLLAKRELDALQFECMYQGQPTVAEGLLYGEGFTVYNKLPCDIIKKANYTDTADTGEDYLCSVNYVVGLDEMVYVTDVVYSPKPMEVTEGLVAEMLVKGDVRVAYVESNNGGKGFARAVQGLATGVKVEWFYQGANKEARILSNSATVMHRVRMPYGWEKKWPEFAHHLATYRRLFRANRLHDAADVLTGIVERENEAIDQKGKITSIKFG